MDSISSPLAEEHALGCLLLNPLLYDDCYLTESDFTVPDYRKLFKVLREARQGGETVDSGVILTLVENDPALLSAAIKLVKDTPTGANYRHYEATVREKTLRRKLVSVASDIDHLARTSEAKTDALLGEAQSRVMELSLKTGGGCVTGGEAIGRLLDQMQRAASGEAGIQTGFTNLDLRWRGMRAGDMIVVAGRPSMGKTSLALQMVGRAAIHEHKRTLTFSLEMSAEQLLAKLMACMSGIQIDEFLNGTAANHPKFQTCLDKFKTDKLIISDSPGLTLEQLCSIARREYRQRGLDLIMVDYIGLIRGSSDSRNEDITRISSGLKALARELRVPIIVLSHLNRAVEHRDDKRPQMSDLRESGALEQDADIILMVYRDEYYDPNTTAKGVVELLTRKHRMGQVGTDYLSFKGEISRFSEIHDFESIPRRPDSAFA